MGVTSREWSRLLFWVGLEGIVCIFIKFVRNNKPLVTKNPVLCKIKSRARSRVNEPNTQQILNLNNF